MMIIIKAKLVYWIINAFSLSGLNLMICRQIHCLIKGCTYCYNVAYNDLSADSAGSNQTVQSTGWSGATLSAYDTLGLLSHDTALIYCCIVLTGAAKLLDQITENEQERLFDLERKDQENVQMQRYVEKMMDEDRVMLEKKKDEQTVLRVCVTNVTIPFAWKWQVLIEVYIGFQCQKNILKIYVLVHVFLRWKNLL